jgi:hypothetical protein
VEASQLGLAHVVGRNDCYPLYPGSIFVSDMFIYLKEYIIVMASSLVVNQTYAMKSLWFSLRAILEMRGSTWGFSLGFITWKKRGSERHGNKIKETWHIWVHGSLVYIWEKKIKAVKVALKDWEKNKLTR